MNKFLSLAVVGLAIAGLASCNENARLASQVEGIWSGSTTVVKDGNNKGKKHGPEMQPLGASVQSVTPSFTFTKDASVKDGGKVLYSGVYSMTQAVTSSFVDVPFEATANVKATASGTWTAKDDDEILLTIDPSSITAEIDPASVSLGYSVLTDKPVSELDSLKAQILPNLDTNFKAEIVKRVTALRKLDDIKIKSSTMTLEIGHTDYTLTKQ